MTKPGEIHQRLVNLKSLLDRINRAWGSRDYEDLMQFFVEIFPSLFKAERCSIFLTEAETQDIWLQFGTGLKEKEIIAPKSGSIVGKAITTGLPVIQGRLDQSAGFHQEIDKKTEFTTRNILCVPIISIVGNYTVGAVEILNKMEPYDFDDADAVLLGRIVKFLALSIENHRVSEEIIRISRGMHEEITRTGEILKGKHRFIASSYAMRQVLDIASKVGPLPVNVFITGASGTGKEVIARLIHESSDDRRMRPFVAVNCSSIPETLMESEFFGFEKGAFTGAVTARMGRFEEASGGTLFLDEIADMPLSIQPKFLRAIQESEGKRLGGQKTHRYQFRIISASSRDLREEVKKGNFREDLFFRLFSVDITIPPLCKRRDDIVPLALMFLEEINARFNKHVRGFSSEVMELFENFEWPGNVRQLQHEVERLVALTGDGETISIDHCSLRVPTFLSHDSDPDSLSLPQHRRNTEIRLILKALQKTKGNKIQAAALLDITRQSLHNKIKLYQIEKTMSLSFPLTED
ncbi:MAG: sigma-54-dependent Fis family transcriptional regulator [Magnetococcales bacterium]|nr:sigma-54-dependent Fis family transcriptional regulator [Magnetococcales bacterium]MBF0150710.1 sigma-54-dependent Fis family transcriptional regulator [Magnetococcales bacterium]MBF0174432.1 sigma-54-dependent Fis family transcriptional regulator [Magnetococcales bacterium]MBF0631665.1 sigma-54-dependent Fis family transcriptional regulator [Magnetococcales bacterium]